MYTIYSNAAIYKNRQRNCKEKGFYAKLSLSIFKKGGANYVYERDN